MYNYYNAWNPVIISIYFTVVVVIGSFFLLNLLLAVLWVSFERAQGDIKKTLANDDDIVPMGLEIRPNSPGE